MPYIEAEKVIKTKVIGVNTKLNDTDDMKVRQVILKRISDDPSIVNIIYLRKREVWITLDDGTEHYIGDARAKYEELIMKNVTQIVHWTITGGQEIPAKLIMVAGFDTIKTPSAKAKYGMNIFIKLI